MEFIQPAALQCGFLKNEVKTIPTSQLLQSSPGKDIIKSLGHSRSCLNMLTAVSPLPQNQVPFSICRLEMGKERDVESWSFHYLRNTIRCSLLLNIVTNS